MLRPCETCYVPAPQGAPYCNHCGTRSTETIGRHPLQEPDEGPYCPVCSRRSPEDSSYCMWYGHSLHQLPPTTPYFCPSCSHKIDSANASKCSKCNLDLHIWFGAEGETQASESSALGACHNCHAVLPANAHFCSDCGNRFATSVSPILEADADLYTGWYCPTCGQRGLNVARFCVWEGHDLRKRPDQGSFFCPKCHTSANTGSQKCHHCGLNFGQWFRDERRADSFSADTSAWTVEPFGAEQLTKGQVVDRYRLVQMLTENDTFVTWEAEEMVTGHSILLHALTLASVKNPSVVRALLKDVERLKALSVSGVVRVLEVVGENLGAVIVATEWVKGHRLSDRLLDVGTLDAATTATMARKILEVLRDLHDQEAVHRDLNPSVVILADKQELKLDLNPMHAAVYTAARMQGIPVMDMRLYRSPEQLRGIRGDAGSDLWSLGCVLYECLVGGLPFQNEAMIFSSDVPARLPDETEPALRNTILQCLCKAPQDRPQNAREALQVLRGEIKPRGVAAFDLPAGQVVAAQNQRRGWAMPLMLVLSLVAVGGMGYVTFLRPAAPPPVVKAVVAPPPKALTVGTLSVQSDPPGATLWVDGSLIADQVTPFEMPVAIGTHQLVAVYGQKGARAHTTIQPGERSTVQMGAFNAFWHENRLWNRNEILGEIETQFVRPDLDSVEIWIERFALVWPDDPILPTLRKRLYDARHPKAAARNQPPSETRPTPTPPQSIQELPVNRFAVDAPVVTPAPVPQRVMPQAAPSKGSFEIQIEELSEEDIRAMQTPQKIMEPDLKK